MDRTRFPLQWFGGAAAPETKPADTQGQSGEGATPPAEAEIDLGNGRKMTAAELAKSYRNLERKATQDSQALKDLRAFQDQWGPVVQALQTDPATFVARAMHGDPALTQGVINTLKTLEAGGAPPTQAQIGQVQRAADRAEDPELAEALQSRVREMESELTIERSLREVGRDARKAGIDFDEDAYRADFDAWLQEHGVGEDEEFTERDWSVFKDLWLAKQQAKAASQPAPAPNLRSGGGAPAGQAPPGKAKTLDEAGARVMARLGLTKK